MANGGESGVRIERDDFDCPICFDPMMDPRCLDCGHLICHDCLKREESIKQQTLCPLCNSHHMKRSINTPKVHAVVGHITSEINKSSLSDRLEATERRLVELTKHSHELSASVDEKFTKLHHTMRMVDNSLQEFGRRFGESEKRVQTARDPIDTDILRNIVQKLEKNEEKEGLYQKQLDFIKEKVAEFSKDMERVDSRLLRMSGQKRLDPDRMETMLRTCADKYKQFDTKLCDFNESLDEIRTLTENVADSGVKKSMEMDSKCDALYQDLAYLICAPLSSGVLRVYIKDVENLQNNFYIHGSMLEIAGDKYQLKATTERYDMKTGRNLRPDLIACYFKRCTASNAARIKWRTSIEASDGCNLKSQRTMRWFSSVGSFGRELIRYNDLMDEKHRYLDQSGTLNIAAVVEILP